MELLWLFRMRDVGDANDLQEFYPLNKTDSQTTAIGSKLPSQGGDLSSYNMFVFPFLS